MFPSLCIHLHMMNLDSGKNFFPYQHDKYCFTVLGWISCCTQRWCQLLNWFLLHVNHSAVVSFLWSLAGTMRLSKCFLPFFSALPHTLLKLSPMCPWQKCINLRGSMQKVSSLHIAVWFFIYLFPFTIHPFCHSFFDSGFVRELVGKGLSCHSRKKCAKFLKTFKYVSSFNVLILVSHIQTDAACTIFFSWRLFFTSVIIFFK